jgi:orotate phosphoribosyltransferase
LFNSGYAAAKLGRCYASAIAALDIEFDMLFGPAYKGIPLVVLAAASLASHLDDDYPFAFNRKEAKDHGEGGVLVGERPSDGQRVLIVEDVTTAGTSIRETVPLLEGAAKVKLAGLVVSVDRQERGVTERSALSEVGATYAIPAFSIVTVDEILEFLRGRDVAGRRVLDDATYARMLEYRREYGAK